MSSQQDTRETNTSRGTETKTREQYQDHKRTHTNASRSDGDHFMIHNYNRAGAR